MDNNGGLMDGGGDIRCVFEMPHLSNCWDHTRSKWATAPTNGFDTSILHLTNLSISASENRSLARQSSESRYTSKDP